MYKTNIIAMLKYRGGLDLGERYGVLVRALEYQLTSIGIKCEMKRVIGMKKNNHCLLIIVLYLIRIFGMKINTSV